MGKASGHFILHITFRSSCTVIFYILFKSKKVIKCGVVNYPMEGYNAHSLSYSLIKLNFLLGSNSDNNSSLVFPLYFLLLWVVPLCCYYYSCY